MFRSAAAICIKCFVLSCVLAAPGLAGAGDRAAHCADDDRDTTAESTEATAAAGAQPQHATLLGSEAPDFTLKDSAGQVVHLRELRGKVVVIDFWASQCPSSRAEMPYLQQLHDQYSARDITILGLNIGEDAHQIAEFATDSAYTFPLLVGAGPDLARKYSVTVYPMTFVIDRSGKITFAGSPAADPGSILRSVKSAIQRKN